MKLYKINFLLCVFILEGIGKERGKGTEEREEEERKREEGIIFN